VKPFSRSMLRGAAVVLFTAAAAGCGPQFDHLEFIPDARTPVPVAVTYKQIEVTVGISVGFTATPMDGNEKLDEDVRVALQSTDPNIVGIDPGLKVRSFVMYGVSAGEAKINVDIDGDREGVIPVTVLPQ
jgi:hypothetical protein